MLSPLLEVEITRESAAICTESGIVVLATSSASGACSLRMPLEDNMRSGVPAAHPRKSHAEVRHQRTLRLVLANWLWRLMPRGDSIR